MKRFRVEVTEQVKYSVFVEAEDEDTAVDLVSDNVTKGVYEDEEKEIYGVGYVAEEDV